MRSRLCVLALGVLACSSLVAQTSPGAAASTLQSAANGPMTDLEVETAMKRAVSLMAESKWQEALPLAQQAVAQRPGNARYAEQLGRCQIGIAGGLDGAAKRQAQNEAYQSFLRARSLGDNSNLVQIMVEQLGQIANSTSAEKPKPVTPYSAAIAEAEKAFSRGDYAGSVPLYEKAAALDPKAYEAPLFAGDAAYKAGQFPQAYAFYARAAAVDPNRETAYRYWGDALMKDNKAVEAEGKFIQAVVAQPYTKASQVGLRQWAQATNHVFSGPDIHLPKPTMTKNEKGGVNIGLVTAKPDDPNGAAWITYQILQTARALPPKAGSDGKPVRHTLQDEASALRVTLKAAKDQKIPENKLDPSIKLLRELDNRGMLESWVLLYDADADIAQDYSAYRDAHRAVLESFVREYAIRQK